MVKRYDVDREYVGDGEYIGAMVESRIGDYILHEDHEQIVRDLVEEYENEIKYLKDCLGIP